MSTLSSRAPTKRSRKRMQAIVAAFQHYVTTYSDQEHYDTYSDRTFVLDMIYGIGIALDKDLYSFSPGLDRFKDLLRKDYLSDRLPSETSDLATAARDMAILALQGNDYHRGDKDFRDAVDDVLAMTDPRRGELKANVLPPAPVVKVPFECTNPNCGCRTLNGEAALTSQLDSSIKF